MATILRPPLVSQGQRKRPIAPVDYFSRPLTLGINPNARIAQLSDSAPQRPRRIHLDVYPNLLGTTLAVVAPATLDLPLRTGRLFESAPRKRWQPDPQSNQGFIVYDGAEASPGQLSTSAPERVRRLYVEQPLNLLGTTLLQLAPLALPLRASRVDQSAPPRKSPVYFEIPQNTLARQPVPSVQSLGAVEQRKRPTVFEHPPNRFPLVVLFATVPDVVGMTQADATTAIITASLTVSVSTSYSGTVAAGLVISQSPAAGSPLELGMPVSIVVSLGALNTPASRRIRVGKSSRELVAIEPSRTLTVLPTKRTIH